MVDFFNSLEERHSVFFYSGMCIVLLHSPYLFHRGQLGLHNNSVAPGLLFCYSPPVVHRRRSSYRPLRIVCTHGLPGQGILRSFAEFLCKETAKKLLFKNFQDSKCLQESTLGRTAPNAKRSLQVEPPSAVQRSH